MSYKFSPFDTLVTLDRIIKKSEEELILILPFPELLPEIIIQQLRETSRRGVRIILIHGHTCKDLSIFSEIGNIQFFSVRHLHLKMIISEKALITGSSNFSSTDTSSEITMFIDSNDENFTKITMETKEILAKAMIEFPVIKSPNQSVEQETIGLMLKQMLENQKDELKDQLMAEMYNLINSAMGTILSTVKAVESEVKESKELLTETNKVVIENYELTSQIRRDL
ncbi:phospholipase D-like domain-containing protein [Lysinibacillus sp. NPDC056232]|uniref:phospholipase D-like domain-containing protein n=1 Tax=Lysinibacillus sp. NPDC056232 TaxID=3345756 RepID=UPI0035E11BB8